MDMSDGSDGSEPLLAERDPNWGGKEDSTSGADARIRNLRAV